MADDCCGRQYFEVMTAVVSAVASAKSSPSSLCTSSRREEMIAISTIERSKRVICQFFPLFDFEMMRRTTRTAIELMMQAVREYMSFVFE